MRRAWLCSKHQLPIEFLMNLHHPSGFAPAGIPVNFQSTCSGTLGDLLHSESSWAGCINLKDQPRSVKVERWKQGKLGLWSLITAKCGGQRASAVHFYLFFIFPKLHAVRHRYSNLCKLITLKVNIKKKYERTCHNRTNTEPWVNEDHHSVICQST